MKKLKDILYNKNDILIALVIISVAAFVIMGRVDSILAYPGSLTADTGTSLDEPIIPVDDENPDEKQDDTENGTEEEPATSITDSGSDQQNSTNKNIKIHIESGSTGEKIAELLVNNGLIESKQSFYNAVAASGADTKLQAGDFTIPANSTAAEIVKIITR